jgi:hypothetical protein
VDCLGTEHAWRKVLKGIREGKKNPLDWMLNTVRIKIRERKDRRL